MKVLALRPVFVSWSPCVSISRVAISSFDAGSLRTNGSDHIHMPVVWRLAPPRHSNPPAMCPFALSFALPSTRTSPKPNQIQKTYSYISNQTISIHPSCRRICWVTMEQIAEKEIEQKRFARSKYSVDRYNRNFYILRNLHPYHIVGISIQNATTLLSIPWSASSWKVTTAPFSPPRETIYLCVDIRV